MENTKIAVVLLEDLAPWQALNVTAFLVSGLMRTTGQQSALHLAKISTRWAWD